MTAVSNTPLALSLSKGRPSFGRGGAQQGQDFDKLSPSGFGEAR